MALVWQCACGASFPETGNASGWGRWRHHLRGRNPGCRRIGLVDEATGEVVVSADQNPLNALREAEQKGYVDPNRPRVRPRAEPSESAGTTGSDAGDSGGNGMARNGSSAGGGSPRNLEAVIPYQRIPLHPRIYMQKAITDDFLVREDGRPYGWDSADVAEWVNGMVDLGFAYVMREHLLEDGRTPEQVQQLLRQGFLSKLVATAKSVPADELRAILREHGVPEGVLHGWGAIGSDAESD